MKRYLEEIERGKKSNERISSHKLLFSFCLILSNYKSNSSKRRFAWISFLTVQNLTGINHIAPRICWCKWSLHSSSHCCLFVMFVHVVVVVFFKSQQCSLCKSGRKLFSSVMILYVLILGILQSSQKDYLLIICLSYLHIFLFPHFLILHERKIRKKYWKETLLINYVSLVKFIL